MQDKKKSMEGQRLKQDYDEFNSWLNKTVKDAGKQLKEVIYILGNHEDWVNQYVESHPEMTGLIEVENNIKISNQNVKLKFVPLNKFYKIGKLYLTHGLYTNKYHAAKMLDSVNKSVMYGHTHDVQIYTKTGLVDDDKHQAISIGCLCDMSPEYMKNRPNNWMHAFAMVDVQRNGDFTPHVVNIFDGKASWNQKLYRSEYK
jgi:hypothetical protein